ncbi:NAD-dependent DNA ligase LigA [Mycoplasma sp. Pen4]|uniref:NAD-dependent DNA ligase LigA n=1 Tax=Mycoplasma sp. Pen4 TaxID=640330 RepID=UPI001654554A|nr:NAD-dependent DNA ligase LigA [Mycoplasma sp. Pen4]QNM93614.1 NAD-dependent DNA ligase LigA [Mycoplasma sp. Pen4]
MTKLDEIQQRIIELTNEINKLNHAYYNLDKPLTEDYIYDRLLRELEELEIKYPKFIQEDSPTKKIGGVPSIDFFKYTHKKPMLSLAKAYSFEEIKKFVQDIQDSIPNNHELTYSLEPKVDGLSISLIYQDGKLERAVTRGDGKIGEDVTKNALLINSIPKRIDYYEPLEVRGEIYISKTQFNKTNAQLLKEFDDKINHYTHVLLPEYNQKMFLFNNGELKKEPKEPKKPTENLFANPRNMAAGTLRQKNFELLIERDLQVVLYDLVDPLEHGILTQMDAIEFISRLGFATNPYKYIAKNSDDIIDAIKKFEDLKDKFEYECDGFVIKLNNLTYWEQLGKTAKFPKYAIAFKYQTEEAYATVRKITTTVGRTGKITYVANFDEVNLNQTRVSNATLHNYDFIKSIGLNIGDVVTVIKSGEIIPKIIMLKEKKVEGIYPKQLNCPMCHSLLIEYDGIVDQFCVNDECSEKLIKNMIHFTSRNAMNIQDLGESIVRILFENNLISDYASIYELHNYKNELLNLPRFAEKKVDNLLNSIDQSRNVMLYKVLFALGIKHIGLQVAQIITENMSKLSDLTNKTFLNNLILVNSIGPEIVNSLIEYISDENNVEQIHKLDKVLNYVKDTTEKTNKLNGLTFVVTGKHSIDRDDFKKLIVDNGGIASSSISKKTNYLIAGDNSGDSKLTKAKDLGITVINENDFLEMIK